MPRKHPRPQARRRLAKLRAKMAEEQRAASLRIDRRKSPAVADGGVILDLRSPVGALLSKMLGSLL